VAILSGLVLSAVQRAREAANRAVCANKIKQLGLAMQHCHEAYGLLPPLCVNNGSITPNGNGETGDPPNTWYNPSRSPLLIRGPYGKAYGVNLYHYFLQFMEHNDLFVQWSTPFLYPRRIVNGTTLDYISLPDFLCPSEPSPSRANGGYALTQVYIAYRWGGSNYAANFFVFGDPPAGSTEGKNRIPQSFPDGMSNTICFGERYINCWQYNDPTVFPSHSSLWADANAASRPQFCNSIKYDENAYFYPPLPGYGTEVPPTGAQRCPMFQDRPDWQTGCGVPTLRGSNVYSSGILQNPHIGGMNVGLADGSVRNVNRSISLDTWQNLCDPRDGNILGTDW
jgi:prepilin-type processing-associated H-X9-DG protein